MNFLSVDVEDWFNILDLPSEIDISQWGALDSRLERNMERLLELFEFHQVKATFFWLGYFADKFPALLRRCASAGHEIGCHGYGHLLAFKVGKEKFREDIRKGKDVIENQIQEPVLGFRAAGFSTLNNTRWTFDEIRSAGYFYDSSVFPASRAHGGMPQSPLKPYIIHTQHGPLVELGISMVEILGHRFSLFGGGYLRLAPKRLIQVGINNLHSNNRPLIVYVHPREIDPGHPRLSLPLIRRFKCYVNMRTTLPKLQWLCETYKFGKMIDLAKTIG